MRLIPKLAACLTAALVLAPHPAQSQNQGLMDFDLTLFGGGSFYTGKDSEVGPPQSVPPTPFRFELDKHAVVGLRLNFITAESWGMEAYYNYGTTTGSYIKPNDRLDLPIQTYGIGVTGLYYPSGNGYPYENNRGRIIPFISGGVGASIFRPTAEAKRIASDPLNGGLPELRESSQTSFHYGAGAKYRLNHPFAIRLDARGILARTPTFGLPTSSDTAGETVIPLEGYMHDIEITFGFSINFGSRP